MTEPEQTDAFDTPQPRVRGRARRTRETNRETMRADGPIVGRNGEVLSRKRLDDGKDIFDVPKELIEPGWEMQWCAVSVVGNTEILMDQNLMFAENGWRPVPAERWPGRFMPVGHKGPIIRGSQMLMERPAVLCEQARTEMVSKARRQMNDRDQSLMGGKANLRAAAQSMGVPLSGRQRGVGADLRMSIDPALDVPTPSYAPADDSVA